MTDFRYAVYYKSVHMFHILPSCVFMVRERTVSYRPLSLHKRTPRITPVLAKRREMENDDC